MIQPTRRAMALFAVGVPVSLLVLVANAAWWPFAGDWCVLILLAFGLDAVMALPKHLLQPVITVPETIYIGERGVVAVEFAAQPMARPVSVEMLAEWSGPAAAPEIAIVTLEPGSSVRLDLPVMPRRRGRILIEKLWLRWTGPLGLARQVATLPIGKPIAVSPNLRGAQQTAMNFLGNDAPPGSHVTRMRGDGSEFNALGEFLRGHDPRHIDWKHSGRHRRLLVKEYQDESNQQIVLAFDTGHLMAEPIAGVPRLDHAITAGLALAWLGLRHGDLVGLFGFDAFARAYLPPVRGSDNFARIQRTAAELDYLPEEANYTLGLAELDSRLQRRALIVLFTDFTDTITAELLVESIGRIARRHLIIFVAPQDPVLERAIDAPPDRFADVAGAVVAYDLRRERRIVFERLERLGIHVLQTTNHDLSAALLNRYLDIKQRGLL